MNCKKCGSQILENEQYCRNCGEPINTLENQNNYNQQLNNINNSNSLNIQPNVVQSEEQVNYTNINNNIVKYKLTIIRKKAFAGWLDKFNIYIDNVLVGKVKNGQTIELEVNSGNHQISINQNNPVNITITENTIVEAGVFGVDNYGITSINGQSIVNNDEFVKKNKNSTNYVFWFSIIVSTISIIMILFLGYYITHWIYAVIIGLGIVNISGLRNQKDNEQYKELMTKNIISIIISTIMLLVTIYLTVFL